MATRITVRLSGDLGLEDAESLLEELRRETGLRGLTWDRREHEESGHLDGGITAIVLGAVVGKAVEMAIGPAAEEVRDQLREWADKAVARWRSAHLDPPRVEVEVADVEAAAEPAAPPNEEEH